MEFYINHDTLQKIKGIKLGILKASDIDLASSNPDFEREFNTIKKFLLKKFKDKRPAEDETVSLVRRMYRAVGWEPTRYRPSSEALIRRILKGNPLYRINIAVDFGNLVSARFHLPMGLYDTAKIIGNVTLDTGKKEETYEGINKPLIHAENKLILKDNKGVFGNPTADSKRTSLNDNTKEALAVFFCPYDIEDAYLDETLDLLQEYFEQFAIVDFRGIKQYKNIAL